MFVCLFICGNYYVSVSLLFFGEVYSFSNYYRATTKPPEHESKNKRVQFCGIDRFTAFWIMKRHRKEKASFLRGGITRRIVGVIVINT